MSSAIAIPYRPDIDGLRAVAIGSVVLYHAFPELVPGGFVGVDVFFVISGFLISSILHAELAQGRLSLIDFYARRIRRLFPTLSVVLLATLMLGWFYLLPHEAANLGTHTAAGAAYVINFVLRQETGYFAAAAETKPLLHLWSLAIEEQFYLVWPALLLLAHRLRLTLAGIGLLTVLSLALCLAAPNQEAAFYLPFYRVWELSAGALVAYVATQPGRSSTRVMLAAEARPRLASLAAVAGLGLIVASALLIDGSVAYPGAWTLAPCLGTLAVLAAGPSAAPSRLLLGATPVVFVGLISYALYLWHWPLLSLAHILGDGADWRTRLMMITIALGLATATYVLLERPIRRASARTSAAYLLAVSIAIAGLGLAASYGVPPPRLNDTPHREVSAAIADWAFPDGLHEIDEDGLVHQTAGNGSRLAVFIGDSTMEQFWPRIALQVAPGSQWTAKFITRGGCPPYVALPGKNQLTTSPDCAELMAKARALVLASDASSIVISGAWHTYLREVLTEKDHATQVERIATALAPLKSFLGELQAQGKRAWLVLMIPSGPQLDPLASIERNWTGSALTRRRHIDRQALAKRWGAIEAGLREVARASGTQIIDPKPWLCDENECASALADGTLRYKDGSHLRASYVVEHAQLLDVVFEPDAVETIE